MGRFSSLSTHFSITSNLFNLLYDLDFTQQFLFNKSLCLLLDNRIEMGTSGLVIWRFRGRYYALYNHYDRYPSGLGQHLVRKIPNEPQAYKA